MSDIVVSWSPHRWVGDPISAETKRMRARGWTEDVSTTDFDGACRHGKWASTTSLPELDTERGEAAEHARASESELDNQATRPARPWPGRQRESRENIRQNEHQLRKRKRRRVTSQRLAFISFDVSERGRKRYRRPAAANNTTPGPLAPIPQRENICVERKSFRIRRYVRTCFRIVRTPRSSLPCVFGGNAHCRSLSIATRSGTHRRGTSRQRARPSRGRR